VALDKYTVKVTLSSQSSDFLDALAEYRSTVVLPEGLREAFGGIESLAGPDVARYITAGPFILTKFTNQVEAEYTANPAYYEQAADSKFDSLMQQNEYDAPPPGFDCDASADDPPSPSGFAWL